MNILYNILVVLFCLLLGYIFGSIPTSIWIGKIFFHQDPRDYGSHNAGGTNAGRLWGKKVGLTIIILDMFKTVTPMWICWALLTFIPVKDGLALCPSVKEVNEFGLNTAYIVAWPAYWLAPLGCVIGHCFPIFAKFKGGKGVSAFMGTIIASSWLVGFVPGLLYFLILKLKKYVSLASILTPIIASIFAWIWAILSMLKVIPTNAIWVIMYGPTLNANFVYAILLTVLAIIIIIRHHSNIKRIKEGNESKIKWMK